jgi:hypothetical protein
MKDSFASLDLDQIRIASPCNARWEDMTGDERARFCGSCRKNVYNLSAMTRTEITTLVREKEGQFCGRFYQRPDGRMLTADCPEGGRRRRDRITRVCRAACAAVLVFFGVKIQANAEDTNKASGTNRCVMGDIAGPTTTMGMVAPPPATNKPVARTNTPPREIMGKIAAPKQTNAPVKIKD